MVWMSDEQGMLFLHFLEVEPPVNSHGNLKNRYVCFYSSEMKNLKQIIETLEKIRSGDWVSLDSGAQNRYQNTLSNLALIKEAGNDAALSRYGIEVLEFMTTKNLTVSNLNHDNQENKEASKNIEKIILKSLSKVVSQDLLGFEKAKEYGKKLLFNLKIFSESIPEADYLDAIDDLDKLLFLQIINSSGVEVRRYFNMSSEKKEDAFNAWNELKNSSNFPSDLPKDSIEKMAYFYTRPIVKSAIQADIRYRVSNCLTAYKEIMDESEIDIPDISRDYQVIHKLNGLSCVTPLLPPKSTKNTMAIPNQLIVSGCPGSGKSWYIRELVNKDSDAQITTITLHPDYNYSDFVGCYKPVPVYEESLKIRKASGEPFALGIPKINYEFVPGPLIDAYVLACKNPNYNVVLVIEEINRTNCNTLFGDVFQLLDRNNSNKSEHEIEAMPDLREYLKVQGLSSTLKLPSNLFICGTMNSADQGVFPLDSAFRRRWEFQYKGYKTSCKYSGAEQSLTYGGSVKKWDDFRGKINESLIKLGIHEDKLIGPYFLTVRELSDSEAILNKLFLFLWDDVLRFERKEVLDFESFAELSEAWKNGSGSPLKIDIN